MSKAMSEIRGQDTHELENTLQDLRKEQFKLRFHGADEGVATTSRQRQIRRTIARILSVIGERARAGGNKS